MRDIRLLLKEGDPLEIDPALAPDDVQAIRRAILAGARVPRSASQWSPGPLATATMLAVAVIAGISVGRVLPDVATSEAVATPEADERPAEAERRQVHFTTPGGTHIVWEFNSDFDL